MITLVRLLNARDLEIRSLRKQLKIAVSALRLYTVYTNNVDEPARVALYKISDVNRNI